MENLEKITELELLALLESDIVPRPAVILLPCTHHEGIIPRVEQGVYHQYCTACSEEIPVPPKY